MQKHFAVSFVCVLLIVVTGTIQAQEGSVPVTLPINGYLAFTAEPQGFNVNQYDLFVLAAQTGDWNTLDISDQTLFSPVWNPDGSVLTYSEGFIAYTAVDPFTGTQTQQETFGERFGLFYPQAWSADGTQILYVGYDYRTELYTIDVLNIETFELTTLMSIELFTLLTTLVTLPEEFKDLEINDLEVSWNPVATNWLVFRVGASSPSLSRDITFLLNTVNGEAHLLDDLVTFELDSADAVWSADGKRLAVTTGNSQIAILYFDDINTNLTPTVAAIASTDEYVSAWLGAGDLFLASHLDAVTEDIIYSIAEIQNEVWFSTEVFRLPNETFSTLYETNWHLSAPEGERNQLTCIFDQTLTTQLQTGIRGRVTFTDGTGTRLRSEPNTYSTQLQIMPEGTSFNILAGPVCGSGYRWWQIELDDGTTGWAAEASTERYFLEAFTAVP